eukprot:gene34732-44919_t
MLLTEIRKSDPASPFVSIERRTADFIVHMFTSSESAINILNDLLQYEHMEAGTFTLDMESLDLARCLENKFGWASLMAVQKGVSFIIKDDSLATEFGPGSTVGVIVAGNFSTREPAESDAIAEGLVTELTNDIGHALSPQLIRLLIVESTFIMNLLNSNESSPSDTGDSLVNQKTSKSLGLESVEFCANQDFVMATVGPERFKLRPNNLNSIFIAAVLEEFNNLVGNRNLVK